MSVIIKELFGKKEHGMLLRLMGPIMIIVLAQVVIFIIVMVASGSLKYVYNSSYQILNEKTTSHAKYAQNKLLSEQEIVSSSSSTINTLVSGKLLMAGKNAQDLTYDKVLGDDVLSLLYGEISAMARQPDVNGAFVILNNGYEDGRYSSVYMKGENDQGARKLCIVKGNELYAQEVGAKKLSTYYFSEAFDFSDTSENDSLFFFAPLNAAQRTDKTDYGYWSMPFKMENNVLNSVTYTEPLIGADGTVYGVIGIEFTENYMEKLLRQDMDGAMDNAVFLLAKSNVEGTYEIAVRSGDRYQKHFENTGSVDFLGMLVYSGIYEIQSVDGDDEQLYGGVKELQLYESSSAFYSDNWCVISVVDKGTLFSFSSMFIKIVAYSIIISALFGLLGVLIVGRTVTQPISSVVKAVNTLDPTKVVWFEKTNIREIDTLTGSIKNLSERIIGSTTKLSQILSVLDIAIGAFEFEDTAELAYCTEGFFELMGWNGLTYIDGYVGKEFLKEKIDEMIPYEIIGNESMYKIPDGDSFRYVKLTVTELKTRTLGVAEDVTKELLEKRKLEFERDYDLLTGIFNRRAFRREVSGLFLSETVDLRTGAIMMLDLDNLKYINDTYGHDYGDEYIRKSAETLRRFEKYGGIVARMSGDEFYVFINGYDSKDEIREIIAKVRKFFNATEIEMPDETRIKLRASAGIAWYPDDSNEFEDLLRYADFAMYTVKHSVKGDISEFDREKYHKDSILLSGKEELNKIIESELVRYALQPIVDAHTGEIFAYEALMRPQGESLKTPLDVIRVARQQAKMYQVEKLTWHKSMQAFINQVESGNISKDARLFLNSFSSQILTDDDFNEFSQSYEDYLSNIVMEVLESDELDEGYARRKSEYVKGWGGKIALDDFGTGYNGDYSLILLNPDLVKIDMNMVRGVNIDENKQELITNLISYAKRQNIKILAEGVQTLDEMETLIGFGVDYMQGNYLSLPMFVPAPIPDNVKESIVRANEKNNSQTL